MVGHAVTVASRRSRRVINKKPGQRRNFDGLTTNDRAINSQRYGRRVYVACGQIFETLPSRLFEGALARCAPGSFFHAPKDKDVS